eukprot:SAG11_NODE_40663_length_199_cov_225.870000_1_plen_66_part_11
MLSPYALDLQEKLEISKDTVPKLVPNLKDKYGYVVDIRNLAYYLSKGLKIKKIHQVITFKQKPWLR